MKWRNISEDEVRQTIFNPEEIHDSIHERKNAYKHLKNKWIKVTYKEELDKFLIVTVIDKHN